MSAPKLDDRTSGVLLHPTSLPGLHGNGDLGSGAYRFVDFLASVGQSWWQMLPVGPLGYGNSPYSAESAFAGSPLLISLEALARDGLLPKEELDAVEPLPEGRVDYAQATALRDRLLRRAFEAFVRRGGEARNALEGFREENRQWLADFALFRALKRAQGYAPWTMWSEELRRRERRALERARAELRDQIAFHEFEQFVFAEQWRALRSYCHKRHIGLIGDIPIFVAHDSADVWQHAELFKLDRDGQPNVVAGVPPDYFSKTGQRWGNPLYRWSALRKTNYAWWIARFRTALERFDAVRLDHFIGFQRYWQIPASALTAETGKWLKGPGAHFFDTVRKELGSLPLIAEDLGAVTREVRALRDQFKLPGIRLLQFAFGTDPSAPYFLPHRYRRRSVAYTGTHDNDTTVGWFHERGGGASTRSEAQTQIEREAVLRYLATDGREIHWDMIRMVFLSVSNLAIIPMQDLLGLGSEARMNRPGTCSDNWEWRVDAGAFTGELAGRLRSLTETYGRIYAG